MIVWFNWVYVVVVDVLVCLLWLIASLRLYRISLRNEWLFYSSGYKPLSYLRLFRFKDANRNKKRNRHFILEYIINLIIILILLCVYRK